MRLAVILKTAFASLGSNRLRTGLTLLGIVIGVSAVISLMAIGKGAQATITARIQSLGTNLLFVRPGSVTQDGVSSGQGTAATLTLDDAYALTAGGYATSIAAVAPQLNANAQVVAGNNNTRTQVLGVTPEYAAVRNSNVLSGQFIVWNHVQRNSEVVVLGSLIAETLFGFRDPVGQHVRLGGRQYTVIGVLKSKGGSGLGNEDNQVLIPITTAYYRLAGRRTTEGRVSVQSINVQVHRQDDMERAVQEVSTVLRLRHRLTGEDDFTISSQQETLEALEDTTNTFVLFLGAIAGISLLVGGIGVMNIMLVSVTERTREIGLRKALGAKRSDIMLQFVAEAVFLTLLGGIIGVIVGLSVTEVLDGSRFGSRTLQTVFSGEIAMLALAVSAGIGLFFGIYPAMRAARLHPIDALRHD